MEYSPYGEQWIDEGADRSIIGYRFTSKEYDTETGLYYFGARYLDPTTSRWMSADPAFEKYLPEMPSSSEAKQRNASLSGEGGVFNQFNLVAYYYAANNPVRFIDPDGKEQNLVQKIMTFAIAQVGTSATGGNFIKNHMSIQVERNNQKTAFGDRLSVMFLGVIKLDTVKTQATADIPEPRLSEKYQGRTLPAGVYTGTLLAKTGHFLNPILLESRAAGVKSSEGFEIHPNVFNNPAVLAANPEANIGPFETLGGISAGCPIVHGESEFGELTTILQKGGYKYNGSDQVRVEIKD
jgi:RHS repeat-associated protein